MDALKAVPLKESSLLRIQNAVHIKGRRVHIRLTEHHMYLAPMMGLMIEEMQYSVWCGTRTCRAQAIGVTEWPAHKTVVHVGEERLNAGILFAARGAEFRKSLEQNSIQWRCRTASAGKP